MKIQLFTAALLAGLALPSLAQTETPEPHAWQAASPSVNAETAVAIERASETLQVTRAALRSALESMDELPTTPRR
ncbi:MAG TPA: hypothetical protein ENN42_01870 [Thioalkalivibrio sp.]|nr:hypothetical protein [Thioalkalivibrio sp.]